jgi:nitrogen fixation protein NifB
LWRRLAAAGEGETVTKNLITLDAIAKSRPRRQRSPDATSTTGGCRDGRCGSAAKADKLPAEVWEKIKDHPCYSVEAHHFFARIHVAVAPACNIQCHYCNRKYDCANESRPGVVSEKLTPEQAAHKVLAVAAQLPQLSVVGIAGPGDALADHRRTFATCDLISAKLPDVKLCLSTNGLALPDHVEAIRARGIHHVTITINAIEPVIAERIYAWIFFDRKRRSGREAARILIERQWQGLQLAVAAGLLVKVNSVMIPGINDEHLKEVSAEVRRRGAFLHNIMPLISDPAHGTHFGLIGQRGPTPSELKALQDGLTDGVNLMKHCRQCRADAIGMLGEDRCRDFTLDRIASAPAEPNDNGRHAYYDYVERERAHQRGAKESAAQALRSAPADARMLVAVCSKGSGRINRHFGHASEFQVFEVDRDGVRLVGHRRAGRYCQGGFGEEDVLAATIDALEGVAAVLCAQIGRCPREELERAGIKAVDDYAFEYIETAIARFFRAEVGATANRAHSA